MKNVDKIFVKIITTIAVILVVLIVIYFVIVPNAFDGTWNHTYFPGSILFFCFVGLIGFFIQKGKNKLSNSLSKEKQEIGMLSSMPNPNIYRRSSGETFLKLNESFHVKAKNVEGRWTGDGISEEIDPKEKVEVIQ